MPDYCPYCKHQGHTLQVCTVKKIDEENKKNNDQEEEVRNTDRIITDKRKALKPATDHHKETQLQEDQHIKEQQNTNRAETEKRNQEHTGWQIQRRRGKKDGQHQQHQTRQHKTQVFRSKGEGSVPHQHNDTNNNDERNQQQSVHSTSHNPTQQVGTSRPVDKEKDQNIAAIEEPSSGLNTVEGNNVKSTEVCGVEEGESQEKITNMQEGATRGRELLLVDPRKDYKSHATTPPNTSRSRYTFSDPQQQGHIISKQEKRDAINKKLIQERQSEQTSVNYVLVPKQEGIQMQSAEQSKLSQKTISDGFKEEYTATDHAPPLQIYDVSNERQVLSKEDSAEDLSDEYRVTHSEDEEDPDQWEDEQMNNRKTN
ncbi:uncharacterized protein LOC129870202 [Solanum dulcamara]|uniref:uncharacterized protein LOC129870202 n=1 Tax=Solanum dulcamara TaxID=45834 RepID=UPI0024862005|nr:uncharacterized protein LOC129870202 [Solanum dulcamara]